MTGALVILAGLIVIGVIIYLSDVFYYRKKHPEVMLKGNDMDSGQTEVTSGGNTSVENEMSEDNDEPEVCCGMHTVCEKTNLSPVTGEIVYYDDEELDRFAGRQPEDYTPEETEEFRDVLLTLLPQDVAGWSRSIQVRGINLPTDVREELLMIVSELRTSSQP